MTLSLLNVSLSHQTSTLLDNFTLSIPKGRIVTLMGPSGCGKSTLLHAIAGHLSPSIHLQGDIQLNDSSLLKLPAYQRNVGLLFQDDLLFPHLNVWENLALGLPSTIRSKERKTQALQALKKLSLDHLSYHSPMQLSGGQRARISLIRTLLSQPKALLLDEPFSRLDTQSRTTFRHWVFEQIEQSQIPTLMVTHDKVDCPDTAHLISWQSITNADCDSVTERAT